MLKYLKPQVYEVKVFSNGAKHWLQNGQHHRLDGPAFECPDGAKCWYIEDKEFSEKEFLARTAPKPPSLVK